MRIKRLIHALMLLYRLFATTPCKNGLVWQTRTSLARETGMEPRSRPGKIVGSALLGGSLMLAAGQAGALPTMEIIASDSEGGGTETTTIYDNMTGDLSDTEGRILFDLNLGDWTVIGNAGITKPLVGSADDPVLDIAFQTVSSSGGGTVTFNFSENGFTSGGLFLTQLDGNHDNNVDLTADHNLWASNSNTVLEFDEEVVDGTVVNSSGGGFTSSGEGVFQPTGDFYSLTQQLVISHDSGGDSSGDARVQVPAPATLGLLGLGLIGVAGTMRRRQKVAL